MKNTHILPIYVKHGVGHVEEGRASFRMCVKCVRLIFLLEYYLSMKLEILVLIC